MLESLKLVKGFKIRTLSTRQFLIVLTYQTDYCRLWMKPIWHVQGFPMRIFKWSPYFNVQDESSIVPIWIRLPDLPVHLYDKSSLWMIGNLIGRPLKIDAATASLSRANFARILVEIDLLDDTQESILLCINFEIICQNIMYENVPRFCVDCKHLGHDSNECYVNGNCLKSDKSIDNEPPKNCSQSKVLPSSPKHLVQTTKPAMTGEDSKAAAKSTDVCHLQPQTPKTISNQTNNLLEEVPKKPQQRRFDVGSLRPGPVIANKQVNEDFKERVVNNKKMLILKLQGSPDDYVYLTEDCMNLERGKLSSEKIYVRWFSDVVESDTSDPANILRLPESVIANLEKIVTPKSVGPVLALEVPQTHADEDGWELSEKCKKKAKKERDKARRPSLC